MVFWEYSGNIRTTSEYQEYRSDIGHNAIVPSARTILDAPDGPCAHMIWWFDDDLKDEDLGAICGRACSCQIVEAVEIVGYANS